MSGGVDSSVSAALLKEEGYDVVGVFIKTWHPHFLVCNEEEERRDAMRVAAHLNIPFLTFDFEKEYKKEVGDYMISEYRLGRTPNPDVMCNQYVKFGAFFKKSLSMGADFVATGHYASIEPIRNFSGLLQPAAGTFPVQNSELALRKSLKNSQGGRVHPKDGGRPKNSLMMSRDLSKDQSYFLWTLKQEQLSKILFPVGHLKKTEVRALAKKFKLPVADKKDSQGICFLGPVDLKEFLKHYIKEKKGKVVDDKGRVIGHHNGATFHTLGERHGFTITKKTAQDKPYYIIGKDVKKNILKVSQNKNSFDSNILKNIRIKDTNWISEVPTLNTNYTAEIRYHGEFLPCTVKITGKKIAKVNFSKPTLVAPGQSIVLYQGNICLGGGVVA